MPDDMRSRLARDPGALFAEVHSASVLELPRDAAGLRRCLTRLAYAIAAGTSVGQDVGDLEQVCDWALDHVDELKPRGVFAAELADTLGALGAPRAELRVRILDTGRVPHLLAADPDGDWELAEDGLTVLAGRAAHHDAVLQGLYERDELAVLHVAAHTTRTDADPEEGVLASVALLTPDRALSREHPVRASQLAASRTRIDLAVLSVCDGRSSVRSERMDERENLAHVMLAAGARTVIACTTPAHDQTTQVLMGRLHHHLSTESPARALRLAQLDL